MLKAPLSYSFLRLEAPFPSSPERRFSPHSERPTLRGMSGGAGFLRMKRSKDDVVVMCLSEMPDIVDCCLGLANQVIYGDFTI